MKGFNSFRATRFFVFPIRVTIRIGIGADDFGLESKLCINFFTKLATSFFPWLFHVTKSQFRWGSKNQKLTLRAQFAYNLVLFLHFCVSHTRGVYRSHRWSFRPSCTLFSWSQFACQSPRPSSIQFSRGPANSKQVNLFHSQRQPTPNFHLSSSFVFCGGVLERFRLVSFLFSSLFFRNESPFFFRFRDSSSLEFELTKSKFLKANSRFAIEI